MVDFADDWEGREGSVEGNEWSASWGTCATLAAVGDLETGGNNTGIERLGKAGVQSVFGLAGAFDFGLCVLFLGRFGGLGRTGAGDFAASTAATAA
jgi:hypothetical protein